MSYATHDFTESVERAPIAAAEIASVLAAWGRGNEENPDMKWSADGGGTEWSGGFLLLLKDESFAYLTGWCDYTGWGCQDGIEFHRFASRPTIQELRAIGESAAAPDASEWDIEPADINRWLATLPPQETP